jgi:hypothetical protein
MYCTVALQYVGTVRGHIPVNHVMHDTLTLAQHFSVAAVHFLLVVALALFGTSAAYVFYITMCYSIRAYRSPLRNLPGPRNAHWLRGSFNDVPEEDSTRLLEEWVKTYGHVLKVHSRFGVRFPSLLSEISSVSLLTILPSIAPETPDCRPRSRLSHSS